MSALGFISLFLFIVLSNALKSTYLTASDKQSLHSIFDSGYAKGFIDPQSVFLSMKGYSLLEKKFDHEKEACQLFEKTYSSSENVNDLYAATSGINLLQSVKCNLDTSKPKKIFSQINEIDNIENLYKIVKTVHNLKLPIDVEHVKDSMEKFLKKDSSAINQAYSYLIAGIIFQSKTDLKKYFVEIEDTIQQADEADNIYAYFEEGTYSTAFVINSIFELTEKYGESPAIAVEKLMKFASFLLSRRHTHQLRTAVELTAALKLISRNPFRVPLIATLEDESVSLDLTDPKAHVRVATVWGDSVDGVQLIAETVKNTRSAVTIMTRKPLSTAMNVNGLYELELTSARAQLEPAFYTLQLSGATNDSRFASTFATTLSLKLVSSASIDNIELVIRERDQIAGAVSYKLRPGVPLADKLAMSWLHRLEMRFNVIDGSRRSITPHQVFARLTHLGTKQEITFVVEPDKTALYKFTLDLEKSNKDFDNLSGEYSMEIVVGDATLERPLSSLMATVKLEMPSSPSTESTGESRRSVAGSKRSLANPRVGQGPSVAKPQIFHMFKPAEKRGGQLISSVFTILCIVPPFAIMLTLWAVSGLNVSNFHLSLSSLLFHAGICAIFGLYYCYWSFLNMFTTLRYLVPIGAVTGFFGNRVLRHIALKRKEV